MKFENFEVTPREIMVSIVILFLSIGMGFFLATKIHNYIVENNDKYFTALKIDNDSDLMQYAIRTEVGNILSYGTFSAENPVKDKMIEGEYFSIIKIKEEKIKKTRKVTYTDSQGKTKIRTETYYVWEETGRTSFQTDKFTYLGETYDFSKMNFQFHSYHDIVYKNPVVRYDFRVIPKKFKASVFSVAKGKTISENEIFYRQDLEKVISNKEKEADNFTILFIALWIVITAGGIFFFYYAENKWLHSK